MSRISSNELADFALFCQQATDRQIENIAADEKKRGATERTRGDGSDYYQECYRVAREECVRRGLE
jgi:hypothetical protein